jgi:hypothetical protein
MTNQNEPQKTKEQLAQENQRSTDEALRLAREQEERDRLAGIKPIVPSVADSIRKKLETEDFKVAVDENGNQVPPRPVPKQ